MEGPQDTSRVGLQEGKEAYRKEGQRNMKERPGYIQDGGAGILYRRRAINEKTADSKIT